MAFTTEQKAQIRKYLGWPGRFHQLRPDLENAFLALDADDSAQVLAELTLLTAPTTGIDARLADALDRLQASAVGSITLNRGEIGFLRAEGRRIVQRMANLLGVRILGSAYGGGPTDNRLRGL